jgi:hypothetical protein
MTCPDFVDTKNMIILEWFVENDDNNTKNINVN